MPTKKKTSSEENKLNIISKFTKFSFGKKIIIAVGVLVVIFILYSLKGLFIAALVNGQPVFRTSVLSELEKQAGKRTLESLIIKSLIYQEAKKKRVSVEKKEIDEEMKKINESLSKQGQNLDQALALQGLTKADLIEQITMQKMIEKIVGKDIKISDKEIDEYIAENKDLFPQDTSEKEAKKQAEAQLRQRKLSEKVQAWITDLQQKSNITYFVNY